MSLLLPSGETVRASHALCEFHRRDLRKALAHWKWSFDDDQPLYGLD